MCRLVILPNLWHGYAVKPSQVFMEMLGFQRAIAQLDDSRGLSIAKRHDLPKTLDDQTGVVTNLCWQHSAAGRITRLKRRNHVY